MASFSELWIYLLYGFVGMAIAVILIGGVFLRGFFFTLMRVRASQGRKIFVRAWNVTYFEFLSGEVEEGFLVFKYNKTRYRYAVQQADFYRMLRVTAIDVDLQKSIVIRRNGDLVSGYDPAKFDNLLVRALLKPAAQDILKLLIFIGVCLILLAVIADVSFSYQALQLAKANAPVVVDGVKGTVGVI